MTLLHSGPYSIEVTRKHVPKRGVPVIFEGVRTGLYISPVIELQGIRPYSSFCFKTFYGFPRLMSFLTLTYVNPETMIDCYSRFMEDHLFRLRNKYENHSMFAGQEALSAKIQSLEDVDSLVKLCRKTAIGARKNFIFGKSATESLSISGNPIINDVYNDESESSLPMLEEEALMLSECFGGLTIVDRNNEITGNDGRRVYIAAVGEVRYGKACLKEMVRNFVIDFSDTSNVPDSVPVRIKKYENRFKIVSQVDA